MSETQQSSADIQVPAAEDFNTVALQGSMQQILSENLGKYVSCEFLIGTSSVEVRTGFIYSVGISFIVLFDYLNDIYVVCDIFAIKFVTFVNLDAYPQVREGTVTNQQVAPGRGSTDSGASQSAPSDSASSSSAAPSSGDSPIAATARVPMGQARQAAAMQPVNRTRQAAFNYAKRKTR